MQFTKEVFAVFYQCTIKDGFIFGTMAWRERYLTLEVIFSDTFITTKSSNSVLQLERAVHSGTLFHWHECPEWSHARGGEGARGGGPSGPPWERSAFNVSHVLETLLQSKRDRARQNTQSPNERQGRE